MVRTHTVVGGDTLSALALRFYGDAELYRLIATASGIADPDVINVGQRLIIPEITRYTVVAGDTLGGGVPFGLQRRAHLAVSRRYFRHLLAVAQT